VVRLFARRLLLLVPTLWAILTVTFVLLHAAPGGPFASERSIPKVARERMIRTFGLDRPLAEQYARYLGHAVRGDLGPSYEHPQRLVRDIVADGVRVSVELGTLALLLALLAGVPLGVFAATRHGRWPDRLAMLAALAGVSVPNFVLGPLLVLVFSLGLYWLPPALWTGPASRVLPVVTLAAAYAATIARLTRAGMIEALAQDHVRTARAKGLGERAVIFRHAMRTGLLPVLSYLGPATAGIVMGSVAVEQVFAVPGLGRQLVGAAFDRDYTLVLGIVLFDAVVLLLLNLAVDLVHARLDPRVEAR